MAETMEQKVRRLTAEDVAVVPYDLAWPTMFEVEADFEWLFPRR